MRDLVAHAFGRAVEILKSRRADLEMGAELLLSRESLTADDFPALRPIAGSAPAKAPGVAGGDGLTDRPTMTILSAAGLYFVMVFAAGFVLGSIRVLWVEAKLGQALAVLCESPLLLAVMVLAARWVPNAVGIEKSITALALMGAIALALQAADFLVGTRLRGISAAQQLAHFTTRAGFIYAFLLIAFAIMPLLVNQAAWHG